MVDFTTKNGSVNPCPALRQAIEIETLKNRLKAICDEDLWQRAVNEFYNKPVVTDSDKARLLDCLMNGQRVRG